MNKEEFKDKLRYTEVERLIRNMHENSQFSNPDVTLEERLQAYYGTTGLSEASALQGLKEIREQNYDHVQR